MSAMHDVLVIGGGPVGATLALALRGHGLDVCVLEARSQRSAAADPRALALSMGSRQILQRLGVWQRLSAQATSIATIHVSQSGRLGRTALHASDEGQEALGYVLPYASLSAALEQSLATADDIQVEYGVRATAIEALADAATVRCERDGKSTERRARLLVLADGGRELALPQGLRRNTRDYRQSALVARVSCEQPHAGVAYERFTPHGPLALLPDGTRDFSLVWSGTPDGVEALLGLDTSLFLKRLHQHFGDRLGRFLAVEGRAAFPLRLNTLRPVTAAHFVAIGNAAQTLHPVAGQGFNLGLRDAWELALTLHHTSVSEIGGEDMLARYRQGRRLDTGGGILFTDFLVRTFSNDWLPLAHARGAGLALLDLLAPARRLVARKMSFGARG